MLEGQARQNDKHFRGHGDHFFCLLLDGICVIERVDSPFVLDVSALKPCTDGSMLGIALLSRERRTFFRNKQTIARPVHRPRLGGVGVFHAQETLKRTRTRTRTQTHISLGNNNCFRPAEHNTIPLVFPAHQRLPVTDLRRILLLGAEGLDLLMTCIPMRHPRGLPVTYNLHEPLARMY